MEDRVIDTVARLLHGVDRFVQDGHLIHAHGEFFQIISLAGLDEVERLADGVVASVIGRVPWFGRDNGGEILRGEKLRVLFPFGYPGEAFVRANKTVDRIVGFLLFYNIDVPCDFHNDIYKFLPAMDFIGLKPGLPLHAIISSDVTENLSFIVKV